MLLIDDTKEWKYVPEVNEKWFEHVGLKRSDYRTTDNKLLTVALFQESADPRYQPIFTTQEFDRETGWNGNKIRLYSLYSLYMNQEDPQEYLFAESVFGSWSHWLRIRNSTLMRKHIDKWVEDLESRLRSKGIQFMSQKAESGDVSASRWMSEQAFKRVYIPPPKERKNKAKENAEHKLIEDALLTLDNSTDGKRKYDA